MLKELAVLVTHLARLKPELRSSPVVSREEHLSVFDSCLSAGKSKGFAIISNDELVGFFLDNELESAVVVAACEFILSNAMKIANLVMLDYSDLVDYGWKPILHEFHDDSVSWTFTNGTKFVSVEAKDDLEALMLIREKVDEQK